MALDLSALTCVCGVAVSFHRIGGHQISCAEALDRAFISGDQVPQSNEGPEPRMARAHVRRRLREAAHRVGNRSIERV